MYNHITNIFSLIHHNIPKNIVSIIRTILYLKKLWLREGKAFSQYHTANKLQSQKSHSDMLTPDLVH